MEFGERVLGETPKVDCTPETAAEFNHHCNLSVTFEDPITLDEIACRPVVGKICYLNSTVAVLSSICFAFQRLNLL